MSFRKIIIFLLQFSFVSINAQTNSTFNECLILRDKYLLNDCYDCLDKLKIQAVNDKKDSLAAACFFQQGNLFRKIGDINISDSLYLLAEQKALKVNAYDLLANIYRNWHKQDKFLGLKQKISNKDIIAEFYIGIAQNNIRQVKNPIVAGKYLDSAHRYITYTNTLTLFKYAAEKCDLFRVLNIKDSALYYLNSMHPYAQNSSDPEVKHHYYLTSFKFHQTFGNYKSALEDYLRSDTIRKQIDGKIVVLELEKKSMHERFLKVNEEKKLLDDKIHKYLVQGFVIAIILIISLLFLVYYIKTNKKLKFFNDHNAKLFHVMSHDVRSPLISVKYLLNDSSELNSVHKASMISELNKLIEIADETLLYSANRINNPFPEIQTVDLAKLIEENIKALSPFAKKKGKSFEFNGPTNYTIKADEAMFNFALRNLFFNSIQHSVEGATIYIILDQESKQLSIQNHCEPQMNEANGIKGNGIGIARKFLESNGANLITEVKDGIFESKIKF